jgi:hypothetical protein
MIAEPKTSVLLRWRPTLLGAAAIVALTVLATTSLTGCQLLAELLGDSPRAEGKADSCEKAQTCCEGLNKATAYKEVTERAGVRDWPNHCPSWNARSEHECGAFLEEVEKQRPVLTKDHPVYDPANCE